MSTIILRRATEGALPDCRLSLGERTSVRGAKGDIDNLPGGIRKNSGRNATSRPGFSQSRLRRGAQFSLAAWLLVGLATAKAAAPKPPQVVHRMTSHHETLELTVNTSRIVTVGKELPRVIINNPEVAEVTALSPTQVQVMAKKPGVTQLNLFSPDKDAKSGDEQDEIYTLDLIVYPDARELTLLLRTQFPTAALKVIPTANAVIVSGYVDDPNQVQRIIDIATDYAPKVLNNIRVGGVQQVLLQIKVMEVSRTKLRNMGFDWGTLGRAGQGFATNGVGQLLTTMTTQSGGGGVPTALGILKPVSGAPQSMTFGVMSGSNQFFGVLNLLTQKNVAKVVAEPQLVTVSGRPASFHVGGRVPYASSVSLAGPSFAFMPVGTQIDFVPIVLGSGAIRLEVRPRVSEIDPSNSQTYNGYTIPGFAERQCDTGVELRSGQTLALAGLVQVREEAQFSGLVWVSDLPLIGIPFRNVQNRYNEVETLIMVTPHLVDGMDACEVPPGGPGQSTTTPDDHELYCRGYMEVPNLKGPDNLGPRPDAHGAFPPMVNGEWAEPAEEKKPAAPSPAIKSTNPAPKGPDEAANRPRPPRLGAGKTAKENTTGFVRFNGRQPVAGAKPTVKAGNSRSKKTPGFIGPTGYDLR